MMRHSIYSWYRLARNPARELDGLTPASRRATIERIQAAADGDESDAVALVQTIMRKASKGRSFLPQQQAQIEQYLEALPEPQRTYYARFRRGVMPSQTAEELGLDIEVVQAAIAKVYSDLLIMLRQ